ncbi:5997_t:CDS:2 [Ambispora gerdemannii]|uniref:GPN-loop GTPase 2 n=1 Tax=Ambispora gerdemannii TaxID=144530 RepID=A0A9N8UZG3_9GLOM|nr:5997_t:CDS:2 [Ambispora gerdemannii]
MPFGQVVIGPPGSGKTTYCNGIQQFLNATGRKVSVINLDPANDFLPYNCAVNIAELITLEEAMKELELGPNGAMVYCMEFLEKNFDWLEEKLKSLRDDYLLFDFPGQVELFTHYDSVKNIIERLTKTNFRLVTVHLVDAHHCTDPAKYISVLLLSLKTMLQIEIPHINVLSKIDLMESYGKLAYNLEFYTEVQDLSYLLDHLDEDPFTKRYKDLNKALCELIEDFGLVGFQTLCIQDKKSVWNLIQAIDKANGYVFGGLTQGNESIMQAAMRAELFYNVSDVQERWLDHRDVWDSWETTHQQETSGVPPINKTPL